MMKAAIFTLDTGAYKAKAESAAATVLKRMLLQVGFEVRAAGVLPQDKEVVISVIKRLADSRSVDLILTTGSVGYRKRSGHIISAIPRRSYSTVPQRGSGRRR